MANTITGLIPLLYTALDVVSRELVGMIPAVSRDSGVERAALNQTVRSFVAPASTAQDVTPGVTAPNAGDQIIGNQELIISKSRAVPVRWNGEESMSLNSPGGPGRTNIMRDQFTQAMRTLVNEMEADLAGLYTGASRAYGTAGTTPFATNLADPAQIKKILDDNGAPMTDRHMTLNTTAGAAMRTLAQLNKANEAGSDRMLRQGVLLDLDGFAIRESAQIKTPAIGTGASYTTNAAGYAIGATAITLITGTGTILAGDIITFAGDTNKYVVATALTGGVVTLAAPGLRVAIAASATAVTVVAIAARNMAFARSAIYLATRVPALPEEGDMADDRTIITDPVSGLSFEIALYRQYRQVYYEVAAAWGQKIVKAEHVTLLLG